MTSKSVLMKSRNLPADFSEEEYEQTLNFLEKIQEIEEKETSHRGIFREYIKVMKLYQSGSLNVVQVKNRVSTIFKNCNVLLDEFYRLLKKNDDDVDVVVINESNLKRIREFLKMLSRDYLELRGEFIETFFRFKSHGNAQLLKEEVDLIFRDYPLLKEEFRMILVDHGLLEDRHEITAKEEDELFESDMYFHSLKSTIKFAEEDDPQEPAEEGDLQEPAEEDVYEALRRLKSAMEFAKEGDSNVRPPKEGDSNVRPPKESDPKKPPLPEEPGPVAVYGALRRFYKQRRKRFKVKSMKIDPEAAVQKVLLGLKKEYLQLEQQKAIRHMSCK